MPDLHTFNLSTTNKSFPSIPPIAHLDSVHTIDGRIRHTRPTMNQFQPSPSSRTNSTMQAMPDSRSQSFEEIYGPPENFLEIEVSRVTVFVFYIC
jgi:hypothetical protein